MGQQAHGGRGGALGAAEVLVGERAGAQGLEVGEALLGVGPAEAAGVDVGGDERGVERFGG
jgi:hypothetical protein